MTAALWIWVIGFSLGATWFDVRTRQIPNLWNVGGIAISLLWRSWTGGLWESVFGAVLVGGIWLFLAAKGRVGVGDAKMATALGASLGAMSALAATGVGYLWLFVPSIQHAVWRLGPGTLEAERARGIPVAAGFFLGILAVGGLELMGVRVLGS